MAQPPSRRIRSRNGPTCSRTSGVHVFTQAKRWTRASRWPADREAARGEQGLQIREQREALRAEVDPAGSRRGVRRLGRERRGVAQPPQKEVPRRLAQLRAVAEDGEQQGEQRRQPGREGLLTEDGLDPRPRRRRHLGGDLLAAQMSFEIGEGREGGLGVAGLPAPGEDVPQGVLREIRLAGQVIDDVQRAVMLRVRAQPEAGRLLDRAEIAGRREPRAEDEIGVGLAGVAPEPVVEALADHLGPAAGLQPGLEDEAGFRILLVGLQPGTDERLDGGGPAPRVQPGLEHEARLPPRAMGLEPAGEEGLDDLGSPPASSQALKRKPASSFVPSASSQAGTGDRFMVSSGMVHQDIESGNGCGCTVPIS